MKIMLKIYKFYIKKCPHNNKNIKTITKQDSYYDFITKKDDIDKPTFIDITYCTQCGKILSINFSNKSKKSNYAEFKEFEKIVKKKIKEISYFDR